MVSKKDWKDFEKGKHIIRQGEKATCVYLIQKGEARVYANNGSGEEDVDIATLGPGEIFGEIGLIGDGAHKANVQAIRDTTVVPVSKDLLDKKLDNSDPLVRRLLEMLVSRIIKANQKITGE